MANASFPPIEEQLRNAHMVLRVAQQPVVRTIILQLAERFSRNGENGSAHADQQKERGSTEPTPVPLPANITEAVRKILPSLPEQVTYRHVIECLTEDGYEFKAKDHRTAVGRVLRRFCEEGILTEVMKGQAGAASVYQRT